MYSYCYEPPSPYRKFGAVSAIEASSQNSLDKAKAQNITLSLKPLSLADSEVCQPRLKPRTQNP